jgi:MtN3 and saliva related transmembrane protein
MKREMFWFAIGATAAILTMFAFLPQVAKIIKTKSVKDISLFALLQFSLGVFLWLLYGIYRNDFIIIVANAISLLIFLFATILYIKYR